MYDAEQEQLRQAFISAVGDNGGHGEEEEDVFGGGVLRELPDDNIDEADMEAGRRKKKSKKKDRGVKIDKKLENVSAPAVCLMHCPSQLLFSHVLTSTPCITPCCSSYCLL